MASRTLLACTLLLACLAPAACQKLSPPWWVTYDLFQAALRPDRCLNISELAQLPHKTEFRFNITVLCADAPEDKLVGLATFLTVRYDFGGQLFSSRVLDSRGKVVRPVKVQHGEQAMKLVDAALQGNPYFDRTAVSRPLPCIDFYWAVFKPEIAQIWIDNLADLYGNLNLLAADLFATVFRLELFGVRATTVKFQDMDLQAGAQLAYGMASEAATASGSRSAEGSTTGSGTGSLQSPGEQQWQQQRGSTLLRPASTSAQHVQQQDAALVAALRQRWQEQQLLRQGLLPSTAAHGRHLLADQAAAVRPPGGRQWGSGSWSTAAKCWALQLAKRVGGDAAVLKALPWVL